MNCQNNRDSSSRTIKKFVVFVEKRRGANRAIDLSSERKDQKSIWSIEVETRSKASTLESSNEPANY